MLNFGKDVQFNRYSNKFAVLCDVRTGGLDEIAKAFALHT